MILVHELSEFLFCIQRVSFSDLNPVDIFQFRKCNFDTLRNIDMSDICITAAVFTTALVLSKVKRKLLDMADETRNE